MNSSAVGTPQPTILVVDDSRHDYDTYVRYLGKASPNEYQTEYLSRGKDLFSSANRGRPHCLLLDLSLPDMTGLEIVQKLKDGNDGALPFPVVIVTGSGDEITGQKAVRLGAHDYLIKEEVTPSSLQRAVEFAVTRFHLEQKLRASEERSRHLASRMQFAADAAGLGFWSWDLATGAINPDENNRRMLGLPLVGPLTYEDFLRSLFEEDRSKLESSIAKCLETGINYDEEFRVNLPDKSIRWISSRGSVIRDPLGAIIGMAGVGIDITPRKQIEESLRKNEERLRLAHKAAHSGAWEWHLDSGKIIWSPEVEALYGLAPGALANDLAGWRKTVHLNDQKNIDSLLPSIIEKRDDFRIEFRITRADGQERWIEATGLVVGVNEKAARVVGIKTDITERKRAEDELRRYQEELEDKVEQRTHQLADSLATVEAAGAIRKGTEDQLRELSARVLRLQDEERARIARDLHDSTGQTLTALKLSTAALQKVAVNVPDISPLFDDIDALADQALQEIRTISHLLHPPLLTEAGFSSAASWYVDGFAKRSGIETTLDLSGAPRLSKPVELALFRVLQESLTNVLKHSESDVASVRLSAEGPTAVLSIRDRGKGIPTDKLLRFNQTGAGVGVGLGGMKQRIRDLGGELLVESDGHGTAVLVSLPLTKIREEPEEVARAENHPAA